MQTEHWNEIQKPKLYISPVSIFITIIILNTVVPCRFIPKLIICEILIRILSQCVFLLYFRFVSLREEMPGKKQLDSDSSALCGVAALAGTTPKGVGPPNGGQTLVRVVASQTFAYETKRGWRTFWIYYLYAPKELTCLNLTENKNQFWLLYYWLLNDFQKATSIEHKLWLVQVLS